ncbi:MAG: HEAT repeat domain-containing protein [Chloroflexi bacterium]|nr:HEAT repeat domain-containing protein [Chloroflexota bacterium]
MSETPPALKDIPKPPSRLPPWFGTPVVVIILAVAVLVALLGLGHWLFVTPYNRVVVTDPVSLGAAVDICQPQVQVEHPEWLSLDDRGVQQNKRIVIALSCATAPLTSTALFTPTVPITFEIRADPESLGWVRFLNAQGEDISNTFVAQVPPGDQSRIATYPECVEQSTLPPSRLSFSMVSTSAAGEEGVEFSIRLESRGRTFLRHAVEGVSGPLSAGQLTLLGSLVALLWRWWERWNKKQREFGDLYEDMRAKRDDLTVLRELYSRYEDLQEIPPLHFILRNPRIEALRRSVEAEECLRRAVESLEKVNFEAARVYRDGLSKWDRNHWAVPVLGCLVSLLDEDVTPGLDADRSRKQLDCLKQAWGQAKSWPRLRCQMVRALSQIPLAEARAFLEKLVDPVPDVRIEIAWALSRRKRPADLDKRLQQLVAAPPHDWLHEMGFLDPFGGAVAESAALAVESFIWEHPLYEQLYAPVSTVLLARAGGGKTTARLALQRRFWGTTDAFMLDYTDFHDLVARPTRITARRHVEAILHCAARAVSNLLLDDPHMLNEIEEPTARWLIYRLLMNHLSDPYLSLQLSAALPDVKLPGLLSGRVPAQAMNDLVTIVQALGFGELYLLVDRLNNLPEAQDTTMAEALFRHLLNDVAFLQVPHLHVKLFLPARWEEPIRSCGGLCSGRVHLRKLEWDEELLKKMLADRLQVAGMESLNRLAVDGIYPRDLDAELAREASGSPRQLVELGETLLRLRALAWEDGGRDPAKARLQTEDWAAMLEYGLRRAAESEN